MPVPLPVSLLVLSLIGAAPEVTNAEAARSIRADPVAFAAADRNGDGRIDDAELSAVRRALAAARDDRPAAVVSVIGSRDRDGDGALTPSELYAEAR